MVLHMPLADAGTPMMWLGAGHLLCGNFAIGVVEAVLIARLFRVGTGRAMAFMVPANYLSMIAGWCLMAGPWAARSAEWFLGEEPLYRVGWLVGAAAVLSFVLSILLEWPFVVGAMWKVRHGVGRTLLASMAAQTASYAILLMLYGGVSSLSLIRVPAVTRDRDWIRNPQAIVYYIDARDRCVYALPLDTKVARQVGAAVTEAYGQLDLITAVDAKHVDLCVTASNSAPRIVVAEVAKAEVTATGTGEPASWVRSYGGGPAMDFREPGDRDWEVWTGFWPGEGLRAGNGTTGETMRLALETPFVQWDSRRASILPGDQVIYQIGEQVVALDLASRRITMLARGYSPVVVMNEGKSATVKAEAGR